MEESKGTVGWDSLVTSAKVAIHNRLLRPSKVHLYISISVHFIAHVQPHVKLKSQRENAGRRMGQKLNLPFVYDVISASCDVIHPARVQGGVWRIYGLWTQKF